MLGADLRLARGLGDAAPLVEHDEHLGRQADGTVGALVDEVGVLPGRGAGEGLGRSCQLVEPEAALGSEGNQDAVRGGAGLAHEGEQEHRRRQQGAAGGAHAQGRGIERTGEFG